MKTFLACLMLATFASTTYAADYQFFVNPKSLGQNLSTLNQTYQLGLKKDKDYKDDTGAIYFTNSDKAPCSLLVETTKSGKIQSISINGDSKCSFQSTKPVQYQVAKTNLKAILNQVPLKDISFDVGCFNCPSRIEITDTLTINKPTDNYYTEFAIEGYNDKMKQGLAKLYLGIDLDDTADNYYENLDKLEEKINKDLKFYERDDVKRLAIQSYDLTKKPYSYKIIAKK